MSLLEEVEKYAKENLSEKRFFHSVGVMNMAGELATIYGVDIEKAKLCGLAHDIAKEMSEDDSLAYVEKNEIEADEIEQINKRLLHGKIGADIAKKLFGFYEQMQKAIIYHTTTDPEMDMLAKIIYVSDKIELGRKSDNYDIEYERELAKKDIDEAIIYIINSNIRQMIEKERIIHPKSLLTRNKLLINKINKNL